MTNLRHLLVIRSVSFQQLDVSLMSIKARFPGHQIDVLTHEHGRLRAEKCPGVSAVVVYPSSGPFRRGLWRPATEGPRYDTVVVPVANASGAGFANVFDFARALAPARVHRCNLIGEVVELGPRTLRDMLRRDYACRAFGAVIGTALGLTAVAWLLVGLIWLRWTRARNDLVS